MCNSFLVLPDYLLCIKYTKYFLLEITFRINKPYYRLLIWRKNRLTDVHVSDNFLKIAEYFYQHYKAHKNV